MLFEYKSVSYELIRSRVNITEIGTVIGGHFYMATFSHLTETDTKSCVIITWLPPMLHDIKHWKVVIDIIPKLRSIFRTAPSFDRINRYFFRVCQSKTIVMVNISLTCRVLTIANQLELLLSNSFSHCGYDQLYFWKRSTVVLAIVLMSQNSQKFPAKSF